MKNEPSIKKSLELPCGYIVPNRIAKAALTEHLADAHGNLSDRHYNLYKKWGKGGAGIILTGNIMVDRENIEGEGNVIVDSYSQLPSLKKWAKAGGPYMWMQIGHAGALSNSNRPKSPSGVAYNGKRNFRQSYEMNLDDILEVKKGFGLASILAKDSGFAGIEIHAAHSFLLNQFLSPITNRRTDDYGGILENRMRLLIEIIEITRKQVGNYYPIAVKINSTEGSRKGWSEKDSLKLCLELEKVGIDLIEISGGNYDNPIMFGRDKPEEYFREFAEKIRDVGVRCPIMLTGGVRNVKSMEDLIEEGIVDIIGLGRPMILDPELPKRLISGEVNKIDSIYEDNLEVMKQLNYYWSRLSSLSN